MRCVAYWRFFHSTNGCEPSPTRFEPQVVPIPAAASARSSTTQSRIASQPAWAASASVRHPARGSARHIACNLGDRPDGIRRFGQHRPDRRQVLRADLRLRGDVGQRRVRLAERRPVLEAPRREEVVGQVGRLPLVEIDDPQHAVLVAVGVGDDRVRREGEALRLEHRCSATLPGRLQILLAAAPATSPATRPSCRSPPRSPDRRETPGSAGCRRPSDRGSCSRTRRCSAAGPARARVARVPLHDARA